MAKKRKAGGRPATHNKPKESERTKFDIEERFDDSGDEFQAGRDQILLDEAPDAKRRRRVAEEGLLCDTYYKDHSDLLSTQRKCFNRRTKRLWGTTTWTWTKTT